MFLHSKVKLQVCIVIKYNPFQYVTTLTCDPSDHLSGPLLNSLLFINLFLV